MYTAQVRDREKQLQIHIKLQSGRARNGTAKNTLQHQRLAAGFNRINSGVQLPVAISSQAEMVMRDHTPSRPKTTLTGVQKVGGFKVLKGNHTFSSLSQKWKFRGKGCNRQGICMQIIFEVICHPVGSEFKYK